MQLFKLRRRLTSYIFTFCFVIYERLFLILKIFFPDTFFFSVSDCEKSLNHYFFFNSEDAGKILNILSDRPGYTQSLINEADKLLSHNFNFLGIKKKLGRKINWNEDISSGFKWPNLYHRYCETIYDNNSDIIMVWELSRFQHLFTLCKAYKLTGDRR